MMATIRLGKVKTAAMLGLLWFGAGQAMAAERTEFKVNGDLIGQIETHKVEYEDTLYDISRRYKVGLVQLMAANPGVDVWVPTPGKEIIIPNLHILPPAKRTGVVVNLSELRMFYFKPDGKVFSWPIGIGREGWQTPVGPTRITTKRKDPVWVPPASIRKENPDLPASVPAGPDNPLGAHAMNLGWPSYTIHGTNKPDGIGRRSSHGCIRMYPEDIEELFNMVSVGTQVTVVDTSHKLGWEGESLYLEVNPTQEQSDAIMEYEHVVPLDIPGLEEEVRSAASIHNANVDWEMVKKITDARAGIPVEVTANARNANLLPDAKPVKAEVAAVKPISIPSDAPFKRAVPPTGTPEMVMPTPERVAEPKPVDAEANNAAGPIPLGPDIIYADRPMMPIPTRGKSLKEQLTGKAGEKDVFRQEDLLPESRYETRPAPKQAGNGVTVYWR